MISYNEVITKAKLNQHYIHGIFRDDETGKIYNVNSFQQKITMIRDPNQILHKLEDTVFVKPYQEYGEVTEVKQDLEWGNHRYCVGIFAGGIERWFDEHELEAV